MTNRDSIEKALYNELAQPDPNEAVLAALVAWLNVHPEPIKNQVNFWWIDDETI